MSIWKICGHFYSHLGSRGQFQVTLFRLHLAIPIERARSPGFFILNKGEIFIEKEIDLYIIYDFIEYPD